MKRRAVLVSLFALSSPLFAAPKPRPVSVMGVPAPVAPPPVETAPGKSDFKLPAVPDFETPQPFAPGIHDVRELRLAGTKLLDTKLKVRGYVIWIYDCVDDVRRPKESRAEAQRRIDDDPTQCERMKLYLGETKTTPAEKGLWVVDVPRPPNKLEKARLPKAELAAWPKVPTLRVGDYVEIDGEFKLTSPHDEANSDGLLIFGSLSPAKPSTPPTARVATQAEPTIPGISPATPPSVPPLAPIAQATRDRSVLALANGNAHHKNRQYAEALAAYRQATDAWPQNHLAWYGIGGSLAAQGDWKGAVDAFEHARVIRPDSAMYQMWAGVASYEAAKSAARAQEAARKGTTIDNVTGDMSSVNLDDALERLRIATQLEPGLWRAQYYLGRIYRDHALARLAAEHFTSAVLGAPEQEGPYIALGELYRRWGFAQQAIDVTSIGMQHIPSSNVSDVFYVLGAALDDKGDHKQAIDAYSKALDAKSTNHKARFARGQAYFKLDKLADAKQDLEAFVAAAPGLEFAKQQANKMLVEIDAKSSHKK